MTERPGPSISGRDGLDLTYLGGAALTALGVAALFFYVLLYVAHTANLAAYPYDLDQGEAYDVNSGWLLAQARPIYTDNLGYPYYSSNYPPLYSLILAWVIDAAGPSLAAGRLLSAAATLLAALVIAVVVGWRTGDGLAALTAGLLFVASNYVFHTTPLARVNGLALLFAVAGLACCAAWERGQDGRPSWLTAAGQHRSLGSAPNRGGQSLSLSAAKECRAPRLASRLIWLAGAAVCFLLALYTKQTTIDAVGAGLLAVALRDLRVGLIVGLVVGLVGGLVLLLVNAASGGAFWLNVVVGNVNPFDPKQAFDYYRNFLELHLVIVGLAGWQVVRAVRARHLGPFELYWLLSLALAISVGKWGAGESYFLAPVAASAVLAGQGIAQLRQRSEIRPMLLAAIGGLLLLQAVLFAHGPLYRLGPIFADRGAQASVLSRWPGEAEVKAAAELTDTLKRADGPVLVEDPSYGLAVGKEIVGNATHLRNLYQAGVWSADGLVADLRERRFSWVVLNAELYPEPVLEAIGRYYYLYEEYEINGTRQRLFAPGEE
jgi:hypothetical protein